MLEPLLQFYANLFKKLVRGETDFAAFLQILKSLTINQNDNLL